MTEHISLRKIIAALCRKPEAVAVIQGSGVYPFVSGRVNFYSIGVGTLVCASVKGLPANNSSGFFGYHIHSGSHCSGAGTEPFPDVMSHYNPYGKAHPKHAGDMPPLLSNKGYAFQTFYTDRFSVCEILNRTLIIHSGADDFTSQPAGNAGEKIACGEIRRFSCGH